MKLWFVRRPDKVGYDEYDSFVCAAETEDDARKTHPSDDFNFKDGKWRSKQPPEYLDGSSWTNSLNLLLVEELGTADKNNARIICASFNAG